MFSSPFLESPEKFSHPKSSGKSQTLQLHSCFIHLILMRTEVPFIQEVSGVKHLSVFRCRLIKNWFAGPKGFRDFWETGPWSFKRLYSETRTGTCAADWPAFYVSQLSWLLSLPGRTPDQQHFSLHGPTVSSSPTAWFGVWKKVTRLSDYFSQTAKQSRCCVIYLVRRRCDVRS